LFVFNSSEFHGLSAHLEKTDEADHCEEHLSLDVSQSLRDVDASEGADHDGWHANLDDVVVDDSPLLVVWVRSLQVDEEPNHH